MKSNRIALAAAWFAASASAPVLAQDQPAPLQDQPAPAPEQTAPAPDQPVPASRDAGTGSGREGHFNGFYVSGTFGLSANNNDNGEGLVFDTNQDGTYGDQVSTTSGANAFASGFCSGGAVGATPDTRCIGDDDDIEWGARVGYDRRFGNYVIGALFEYSGGNGTDRASAFSTTPASYTLSRNLNNALSLRLRGGYTPGGGALFYATGGVSNARIDHGFQTTNGLNAFEQFKDHDRVWGWQAGGGAEIMVTDRIGLGMEYLYNRFKDDKHYVLATAGGASATSPFTQVSGGTRMRPSDTRYDFHSLRGSLSFHF